jgi:Mn2+/Fe2+ NRAMP family transporter
VGIVLFLVVACFQFSNNVAVVAALETFVGSQWSIAFLVLLNIGFLAALFVLRGLYRPIEVLMKVLVGLMMLAFLGNLVLSQPSLAGMLGGLVPQLPEGLADRLVPIRADGVILDPFLPVQALIGTTFSVAGAFYVAYLVREKGWTGSDLRRGFADSVIGISVLAILTVTIMVTAAAVLHGRVQGSELESATDVAAQLTPLFGQWANLLFSVGLLAGAFSSFLVNVMIGGTVLSDGLGLGGHMDQRWPKIFTAIALLTGMGVAIAVLATGESPVRLVIFAQAMTVLGNPVLAGVLLWLSIRTGPPLWIHILGVSGFLTVLALAFRTGLRIYLQTTLP